MPKEISRSINGDRVIIVYDDGSTKELATPATPPTNLQVDVDVADEGSGHSFTDKELHERGYQ